MAIASTLQIEYEIVKLRRPTRRGRIIKRVYSFTKLNSDTSVTIATNIGTTAGNGKILATPTGAGNIVDKPLSFTFVVATGVITILNGTTGATIGSVEVYLSVTG